MKCILICLSIAILTNFINCETSQCPGGRLEIRGNDKFCFYDKETTECYRIISSPSIVAEDNDIMDEANDEWDRIADDPVFRSRRKVNLGHCCGSVYERGRQVFCCERGFESGVLQCRMMTRISPRRPMETQKAFRPQNGIQLGHCCGFVHELGNRLYCCRRFIVSGRVRCRQMARGRYWNLT